jgi:hypothetical protein
LNFASVGDIPAKSPDITFTETGPLNFDITSGADTIGHFLTSGGATIVSGASHSGDLLSTGGTKGKATGTLIEIMGQVSLVNGQSYDFTHDDGVQLKIGNTMVINDADPTFPANTPFTWTGSTGTFKFALVYGECCGLPAELETNLPLTSGVPEPSTWAMMLAGFGGLGFAAFRRSRKASIAIA